MNRLNWELERDTGIGASDAAAVIGVSKYSSPYALWAEKSKKIPRKKFNEDENEALYWGHALEDRVAVRFAEKTGCVVENPGCFTIQRHPDPEYHFMICTLDRIVRVPNEHIERIPAWAQGRTGVLEIKTSRFYGEWEEESSSMPVHVWVQVQHQMAVTQYRFAIVAVLINGNTFKWFYVPRDDDFILSLVEAETEFWRRVVENDPPDVDGHDATGEALKHTPYSQEDIIAFPHEAAEKHESLISVKKQLDTLEEEKSALHNWFKAQIGTHRGGYLVDSSGKRVQYTFTESTRKPTITVSPELEAKLIESDIPYEKSEGVTSRRFNPPRSKK